MGISRRRILALLALAVASLICSYRLFTSRWASHVAAEALRRRLEYLTISTSDLEQFRRDYVASLSSRDARGLFWLSVVYPLYLWIDPDARTQLGRRIYEIEERICSSFLLSSDFSFGSRAGDGTVRYIALYDPYQRPCANPFFEPVSSE